MTYNEIYALLDYRSQLSPSVRSRGASIDIELLKKYFSDSCFHLIAINISEVKFRSNIFKDKYVIYTSSQDRNLYYKDFIEDILLGLLLQGARLIPNYFQFRAHHNKVFMEIMRDSSELQEIKNIISKGYGTYEEFERDLLLYPGEIVIKPSAGAMGSQIMLSRTDGEKRRHAAKISDTFKIMDYCKKVANIIITKKYIRKSDKRRKFIIQNYIPGLQGDYKVLIYFDKYYVLYRENRKNDFRASGSGKLQYKEDIPYGLLDFSEKIFNSFDTPFVSLDIAYYEGEYYLFEFQYLYFGTYTIEKSKYYYKKYINKWTKIIENPVLEREYANSIVSYIFMRWGKNADK